jgi:hypothetical protein
MEAGLGQHPCEDVEARAHLVAVALPILATERPYGDLLTHGGKYRAIAPRLQPDRVGCAASGARVTGDTQAFGRKPVVTESRRWGAVAALSLAAVVAMMLAAVATASKHHKAGKFGHIMITLSGKGMGNYTWNEAEQDATPGLCNQPGQSAKELDNYTYSEQFKFSYPNLLGTGLGKDVKAGGDELSSGMTASCTNGFGNPLGGTSYSCTAPFEKAPMAQSDAPYPKATVGGSGKHMFVKVTGGIQYGAPQGTNCIGVPVGGAPFNFVYKLNGELKFAAVNLQKHGSLSGKIGASKSASCNSTTCNFGDCSNNNPAGPQTTCSTSQSYAGEVKVQLIK